MSSELQQDFVTKLYNVHGTALKQYLSKWLPAYEDATDISQEVFLRILRQNQSEKLQDYPRAYLFQTAKNLMRDQFRKDIVREKQNQEQLNEETLSSLAPTPEENLVSEENTQALKKILQNMPAKYRDVFLCRQVKNMSYEEIATHTKLSQRTVQRYMKKAIIICHKHLTSVNKP